MQRLNLEDRVSETACVPEPEPEPEGGDTETDIHAIDVAQIDASHEDLAASTVELMRECGLVSTTSSEFDGDEHDRAHASELKLKSEDLGVKLRRRSPSKTVVVVHSFFSNPKDGTLFCDDLEFDCESSTNLNVLQRLAIGSIAQAQSQLLGA